MRRALVSVLFLIPMLSGQLLAQEGHGYEIGGFAGLSNWQERNFQIGPPQALPPINLGLEYENEPLYGVRFNFLSRGHWGGEFAYSYQRNTVSLTRESFDPVELKGGVHHFFYNTIFYPWRYSNSRVKPFLTGGLGVAGYQLTSGARARAADPQGYGIGELANWDNRFAFNYGGGVKANVSSKFGIRFDFRHNFSDVPSYGLPKESSNPSQIVLPIQGKLQSYDVTAGIYFHILK
jgi:opacity protein-like surface antigen